jgi:hypothetical protein
MKKLATLALALLLGLAPAAAQNINTGSQILLNAVTAGTFNSPDNTNSQWRGLICAVDLITVTTATVTVHIQGKDTAAAVPVYYDLLVSAALAAPGVTTLTVYPGAATTANVSIPSPLPATWRAQAVVTGTLVTGSVDCSMIL